MIGERKPLTPLETIVRPAPGEVYTVLPDGRWAFFFDHHLIDTFNTCERKFFLRYMSTPGKTLRRKGLIPMKWAIGSWWSYVLEDFYTELAGRYISGGSTTGGVSKSEILSYAVKHWASERMNDYASDKHFKAFAKPMAVRDILRIVPSADASWGDFLSTIAYGNPPLVAFGPILMAARYHDTYAAHDACNWKIISAEKGFGARGEVLLGENDSVVVYYMGRPDLVVLSLPDDSLMPVDHKTSDHIDYNFDSKWQPHPQTAGYIFAVGKIAADLGYNRVVDRCIINGAARLEPSDNPKDGKEKPRFKRAYPNYSPSQIEEWRLGVLEKARRLRYCVENNVWSWKESSCHTYSGCDYRPIDSRAPGARDLVIATDYEVAEPWSPYEVGDDNG